MLISVYRGKTRERADRCGDMYFETAPQVGEEVELANSFHTVLGIWHLPDTHFAGPKLGVLVSERIALQQPNDQVHRNSVARSLA
jgi:hypothetical protein